MKNNKQIKTNIKVGSIMKAKIGEMEDNTREGKSRRMRKLVVVCVQAMVGEKKFLVQFEDFQKIEMIASLLSYEYDK